MDIDLWARIEDCGVADHSVPVGSSDRVAIGVNLVDVNLLWLAGWDFHIMSVSKPRLILAFDPCTWRRTESAPDSR
jgi:hypothetical protein